MTTQQSNDSGTVQVHGVDVPAGAVLFDGSHVNVVHAETNGTWSCPADYLPIAVQRGWVPTEPPAPMYAEFFDPGTAPVPGEAGSGEPEATGYDPSEHTVDEVNAYLASLGGESPGEIARVLEAEAAGQARKGILHGPHGTPIGDDTSTTPNPDSDTAS